MPRYPNPLASKFILDSTFSNKTGNNFYDKIPTRNVRGKAGKGIC